MEIRALFSSKNTSVFVAAFKMLTDTGKDGKIEAAHEAETEQQHVDVEPRTIRIYISKQEEGASVNSQQQ